MSHVEPVHARPDGQGELARLRRGALIAGVAGVVLCLLGAFFNLTQFFHSYLWAYLFWLGLALGCFGITMLQHVTGGRWGLAIRRLLETGAMTLPLMALLFVPLIFGLSNIYEWTHDEVVQNDPILQHKQPYLNIPFFLVRAALYFVIWIGMALLLNRWSAEQDRTANPNIPRRFRLVSAPGLLIYVLTVTFAVFDWSMSLEPHWYSTIYGAIYIVSQGLTAFAFMIIMAAMLAPRTRLHEVATPTVFNDLGNLLLAFVMLWGYMSFSQFIIIWSGNLPEEVTWYLHRSAGGWVWVAVALFVFHFAFPFMMLLPRQNKRRPHILLRLALFVFIFHLVHLFWLVMPAFHQEGFHFHWLDLAAPIAIGGIWLTAYLWLLQRRPLVALKDHRWEEAGAHD
jgi:hypothetical protein